jgi:hypothetical protein
VKRGERFSGVMIGRTRLSERGGERVGLGRLGAGWADWLPGFGPVGLLTSFFFLLLSFSFILDFCLEFLKSFSYSDLNEI